MSENARSTNVQITFAGVNITDDIKNYLLDITYTDSEEDESDDLQISLQDRDQLWLQSMNFLELPSCLQF